MPCRVNSFRTIVGSLLLAVLIAAPSGCGNTSNPGGVQDAEFNVPQGKPAKILKFIQDLRSRQHKFASQQEAIEYSRKSQQALIEAGDRILAQECDDATAREAATLKMIGTLSRTGNFRRGSDEFLEAAKTALDAVEQLRNDKRPAVALAANEFWVPARALNFHSLSDGERTQLAEDTVQRIMDSKYSQDAVADGTYVAERFAEDGNKEFAASFYERMGDLVKVAPEKKVQMAAKSLLAQARRLRLLGNFLPLDGKLFDGSTLDWPSYRGKVVLVDFWATWCGPCVAELPNVKACFQKYHDRGFDVVAVSLDHDRKSLETFLKRESLPWVQVFDDEIQVRNGQPNPMAVRYHIESIPTAFLVDAEGKVVSAEARGEELDRLLEKILGSVE